MPRLAHAYFDSEDRPKLRMSYCVFADVLGFADMTKKAYKEGEGQAILDILHKIITDQSNKLKPDDNHKAWWQAEFFTDNMVLGRVINSDETEAEFGSVVMDIIEYQLEMTLNGFFVRGGMSLGDLFMDDNLVFGPALVEAHLIEQSIARDPRIILSKDVIRSVKRHLKFYGDQLNSPQNLTILIDADGRLFTNYLYGIIEYGDNDTEYMKSNLKKHKGHIESGLILNKTDPIKWSKYNWLANYHDYFCQEFKDWIGDTNDCLITDKLAERHPSRLIKRNRLKPHLIV